MIRTLIVDDEKNAREAVIEQLSKYEDFEIIGQAENGKDAIRLVEELSPDVLFMDITMPVMTGLETARELIALPSVPHIVFITAHNEYAVDAFELDAIDYLLKPFEPERFGKTIEKLTETLKSKPKMDDQLKALMGFLDERKPKKIACYERGMKDKSLIDTTDIYYICVKNSETYVCTENKELLTQMNLKSIFSLLDPKSFFQTHRAYIVNLDKVAKVCPLFSGNYTIILKDANKSKIPLSRTQGRELKKIIDF